MALRLAYAVATLIGVAGGLWLAAVLEPWRYRVLW